MLCLVTRKYNTRDAASTQTGWLLASDALLGNGDDLRLRMRSAHLLTNTRSALAVDTAVGTDTCRA